MKFFAIILFLIGTCFVVATKAQQSTQKPITSKSTTSKTTISNQKVTTMILKTSGSTTTKKTTLKSTVKTTTSKPIAPNPTNVSTTTTTSKPPASTKFLVCRETNSTAASGTISLDQNSTKSYCRFDIVAPSGQQVQILCSSIKFTGGTNSINLTINGDLDNEERLIVNRMYYSVGNILSLIYSKTSYRDAFDCNWTTAPKEITTESKLCRHAEATAANGTIQSLAGDGDGTERECSFLIKALPDQQIQIFCPVFNFSLSYFSYLKIYGTLDESNSYTEYVTSVVTGRIYYSSGNNINVTSKLGKFDSFMCKWTTIPKEMTTQSKLCRHAQSSTANGTIQPLASDGGPARTCFFTINAPTSQRIQISCSVLNITSEYGYGYMNMNGVTETVLLSSKPVLNRVYYSIDNSIYLTSEIGNGTRFNCNWTTIPKENTSNAQVCRHGRASSANGTIQPLTGLTDEQRNCVFYMNATSNYQIQMSCTIVNTLVSINYYSYLRLLGFLDTMDQPIVNRTYYSTADNDVTVNTQVSKRDGFICKWAMVLKENTTNSKLCRHAEATTETGTIQPIAGDTGPPRECSFSIKATYDKEIQISCTAVNMTSAYSYLAIFGSNENANPPVLNRVYTSNRITVKSQVGNGDWFSCQWNTIPLQNTTDARLCRHANATAANGTIQPIAGDSGPPRECSFFIGASYDQQIQISCSVVSLVDANSYFRISGAIDNTNIPVVNRVYTSTEANLVVNSRIGITDRINCKWTTTPKKITATNKLCFQMEATTPNGTIEAIAGDMGSPRFCRFFIDASYNQQIQISCSKVSLTNSNYFRMIGTIDLPHIPVVNRVYTSDTESEIAIYAQFGNGDYVKCDWTTTLKEITNNAKLCRHAEATADNGTIQPIAGDTGPPRWCSFNINAPPDQQIQISCSVVNLVDSNSYFKIFGIIEDSADPPVVNTIYTSKASNQIIISSQLDSKSWISCNWTTTTRRNTTDYRLCQHENPSTTYGTIQPLSGNTAVSRSCLFSFNALSNDQQIQISCPVVNLTGLNSYYKFYGTIESANPPVVNRVYYTSAINNEIGLNSQLGNADWIKCNWTTIPTEITNNSKLCRHTKSTTASGTIQPLAGNTGPPRECSFFIETPKSNQEIQISCSAINLTSASSSLSMSGTLDGDSIQPVVNRVYYSTSSSNYIILNSNLGNGDWVNCKWTTVARMNTSESKLCRHETAATANGTLTPLTGDTGPPRKCSFVITNEDYSKQIQISCSVINLIGSSSSLSITGTTESADPPVVNKVYTSTYGVFLESQIGNGDWFNCKWTTI